METPPALHNYQSLFVVNHKSTLWNFIASAALRGHGQLQCCEAVSAGVAIAMRSYTLRKCGAVIQTQTPMTVRGLRSALTLELWVLGVSSTCAARGKLVHARACVCGLSLDASISSGAKPICESAHYSQQRIPRLSWLGQKTCSSLGGVPFLCFSCCMGLLVCAMCITNDFSVDLRLSVRQCVLCGLQHLAAPRRVLRSFLGLAAQAALLEFWGGT